MAAQSAFMLLLWQAASQESLAGGPSGAQVPAASTLRRLRIASLLLSAGGGGGLPRDCDTGTAGGGPLLPPRLRALQAAGQAPPGPGAQVL